LTYRESLRDIETCLSVQTSKLYSIGFRDPVRRSTLADANEARDWRIYAELAQRLIGQARRLYINEALGFDLANTVYALDSTTIDLCLAVFPWAHFRATKACPWRKQGAAVKMHTLLDLRGNIPSFIHVSDGKLHDVHALDPRFREGRLCCSRRRARSTSWIGAMSISPGSMCCTWPEPSSSPAPNRTWMLSGLFRRRRPHDRDHLRALQKPLASRTVLQMDQAASADHAFFGTSENAVKTQIWIAVSVYVLVAIVKKRLALDASLYTLLQILSVTLFVKMPMHQALAQDDSKCDTAQITNQLNLFAY
jgi:hypothetical protein